MPRGISKSQFDELALAVAAGRKVSSWCEENGVAPRTAYAWYKREEFRRLVARYRRRVEERAVGRMARNFGRAVAKVVQLIEEGVNDHIKLSAAEILIDKLLYMQKHAELKQEIRRLEERLAARESRL